VTIAAHTQKDRLYKTTFKYYFAENYEEKSRRYIGIEASWRDQQYHIFKPSYFKNDAYKYNFSSADVERKRITLAFIFGIKHTIVKRFDIEAFSGIGLRFYEADFSNVIAQRKKGNSFFIHGANHYDGESIGFHIPFGARLSFSLNR
jgi:hypothetical protein